MGDSPCRNLEGDHDELVQYQRSERDGHDVDEFGFKEEQGEQHDDAAFIGDFGHSGRQWGGSCEEHCQTHLDIC